MRVVEGQERAMLIIIDQRRIERAAAEDTRADEVLARRTKDEKVGEAVIEPFGACRSFDCTMLGDCLEDEENKRKHLDEREH